MTTEVITATLIMSASEIATRKSFAGADNTLNYYIAQAGETTPQFSDASPGGTAWELATIRETAANISIHADRTLTETSSASEADFYFYIHGTADNYAVSGVLRSHPGHPHHDLFERAERGYGTTEGDLERDPGPRDWPYGRA